MVNQDFLLDNFNKEPMVSSRIMASPAIRCSRCITITDTRQRAAATIGARF